MTNSSGTILAGDYRPEGRAPGAAPCGGGGLGGHGRVRRERA
jgi:hypothetical protein